VVLGVSLVFYSRHRTFQGIVASAGGTLLTFVYLGLMFGAVLALRREHTIWTLLWVLMVIKSSDIGAYFTGKSIGRHKLIPWLSPGKTWEGLLGGMVFAALAGAVGLWLLHNYDAGAASLPKPRAGVSAGAVFAGPGLGGDLVMSLFKRDAGIKDSSTLLPGFGGVLDVLDSPLLVTPAAYWWLWLITRPESPMGS
jgi:phosphatidate cytidylyltransferase